MKRGFTLIELLIVIGILSILATTVTVILNPAELLKQARDATRISDLGSVKSAIGLYLATASSPSVDAASRGTFSTACWFGAAPACSGACAAISTSTSVDGTGWVRVNLTGTTGGSPLSAFPLDPSQNVTNQYTYIGDATNLTFELNGNLESTKYQPLEGTDGGNCTGIYEVGTDPGLDL